ncbi:GNAT family N-acetyltransferase [Desulfobacula sp.]|uniref:GNAT family N-acetyltransferase n=1 Tax=Desulfobacula sp. TaxID=2593537 RepID=UPI0025BA6D2D|nr:GNAT family N-acetyltransferase [Desulfobacula sp.]MBC2704278.1 GNAT family N-acetyltransferase [Desulfobacula sp.]
MPKITIRKATIEDAALLLRFVHELAKEEKAEHKVKTSKEQIVKTLFGKNATAHVITCEADGVPIGHAVYFFNYSTWQGKNGLYIEDLYISPEYRNCGAGKEILKHLSCLALEKDCGRIEWSVLHWNASAIGFYESLGAKPQDEWIRYRLSGKALKEIACS